MSFDDTVRAELIRLGAALYDRGLTPGRTGNLSIRIEDRIMITPTNACLGRLDPDRLAVTSIDGAHLAGDPPSKELVLHRALYRQHPTRTAVAHLHSTSAVAVSCLPDSLRRTRCHRSRRTSSCASVAVADRLRGAWEHRSGGAGLEGGGALARAAAAQPWLARGSADAGERSGRGRGDRGDGAAVPAAEGTLGVVPE